MVKFTKDLIKDYLRIMGFKLKEGKNNIWVKKYSLHNNYFIEINLDCPNINDCKIDWGKKIKKIRKTTSNFSQPETLVVLECVDRLLEKGYKPNKIILEKNWPLGHTSGYLDIQILKNKDSFLMIECKTWGKEYKKEKMIERGGQLFSYYIQEPKTQYLCLYSSHIDNNNIEYQNQIIKAQDDFKNKNQDEIHETWNKLFEDKGIFEEEITHYNIKFSKIKKYQLKELTSNDGSFVFNRFAEILRKNIISDKTNAFNKIFNLFLCKIVDEDSKNYSEEMDFQWIEGTDNKKIMLTLNDLYKKGMKDYLQLEIADYTQKEIDKLITNFDKDSVEKLWEVIIELRLYTNNEFAFKEVFDKKTFKNNCLVVKEVVQLLEKYKLKYSTKHQFLGDFFEKILNTGIKQEAGQFFTPVPLARFICKSLPIENIINNKNENKDQNFLPYVIDYASGSGHFLTEIMVEINNYFDNITDDWIKGGKRARDIFNAKKDNFLWVNDYIYGIEKDYRLAKTSKVSCFLNGDGDANIFCADGLDNFKKSTEYKWILKKEENSMDNSVFDILVSNPPYSVSGFRNTLKYGSDSFELYKYFTEISSEIECLFIERAKQLLKIGGIAGIIVPTTMLTSNNTLYTKTREIILKNFSIKGIVTLESNAFMSSGKNTSILFLQKINIDIKNIEENINQFFKTKKDFVVNEIEKPFTNYVKHVFDLDLKDYITMIELKPNEKIKKHFLFKDYEKSLEKISEIYEEKILELNSEIKKLDKKSDKNEILRIRDKIKKLDNEKNDKSKKHIMEKEFEKIKYFIITYKQKLVLVNCPQDVKEEKKFLGYEFSNRRGKEGIKKYDFSILFDDKDRYNVKKINSYILSNFKNENIENTHSEVKKFLKNKYLHEVMDFDTIDFGKNLFIYLLDREKKDWDIYDLKIKKILDDSKGELIRVKDCMRKVVGNINKIKQSEYMNEGKIPIVSQNIEIISGYTNKDINPIKKENLPIIVFGDHTKIIKYIDFEFVCGADGVQLVRPKKDIDSKLLYYILKFTDIKENQPYERHFKLLKETTIKLPKNQKILRKKIDKIENEKKSALEKLYGKK